MDTIALRFGEHFSPECGTIAAHQKIIDEYGYVWYGKMGAKVASTVSASIMKNDTPFIILIQSGKVKRYFAYVSEIKYELPELDKIPSYYRNKSDSFKTWFKITKFEEAPRNVLSRCMIRSSGRPVSDISRHSMSPYFIITYEEGANGNDNQL